MTKNESVFAPLSRKYQVPIRISPRTATHPRAFSPGCMSYSCKQAADQQANLRENRRGNDKPIDLHQNQPGAADADVRGDQRHIRGPGRGQHQHSLPHGNAEQFLHPFAKYSGGDQQYGSGDQNSPQNGDGRAKSGWVQQSSR